MRLSLKITLLALITGFSGLVQASEYPYSYRSAYYLGRGDTGIAVADNEEAIFYNPAGLAQGKSIYKKSILASPFVELSMDTKDAIKQIAIQEESIVDTLLAHKGKPQHLALSNFSGIILRRAAIGLFATSGTNLMLYKSPDAGSMESILGESITTAGMTFSLAQDYLNQTLFVGVTAKVLYKAQAKVEVNAAEIETMKDLQLDQLAMAGQGTGLDLGVMWKPKIKHGLALGLTIKDLGDTSFEPSTATTLTEAQRALKNNKQTVNLGVALEPGTLMSKFKVLMDVKDIFAKTGFSFYSRTHMGAELTVKDIIGVTGGLNQGYPTFGMYLDLRFIRTDLGIYTEEIGPSVGRRPDTRYYFKLAASI